VISEWKAFLATTASEIGLVNGDIVRLRPALQSLGAYSAMLAAALLCENQSSVQVFAGKKTIQSKRYREGLMGLLERLGMIAPDVVLSEEVKGRTVSSAMPRVLRAAALAYHENSHPSTPEIIAFIRLLGHLRERITSYEYLTASGTSLSVDRRLALSEPVTVSRPFTFVIFRNTMISSDDGHIKPHIDISSRTLRKGSTLRLAYRNHSAGEQILRILLPAVLNVTEGTDHFVRAQSVAVHLTPRTQHLHLRAHRRGKGHLKALVEDMYQPAKTSLIDLGWVEVV